MVTATRLNLPYKSHIIIQIKLQDPLTADTLPKRTPVHYPVHTHVCSGVDIHNFWPRMSAFIRLQDNSSHKYEFILNNTCIRFFFNYLLCLFVNTLGARGFFVATKSSKAAIIERVAKPQKTLWHPG